MALWARCSFSEPDIDFPPLLVEENLGFRHYWPHVAFLDLMQHFFQSLWRKTCDLGIIAMMQLYLLS